MTTEGAAPIDGRFTYEQLAVSSAPLLIKVWDVSRDGGKINSFTDFQRAGTRVAGTIVRKIFRNRPNFFVEDKTFTEGTIYTPGYHLFLAPDNVSYGYVKFDEHGRKDGSWYPEGGNSPDQSGPNLCYLIEDVLMDIVGEEIARQLQNRPDFQKMKGEIHDALYQKLLENEKERIEQLNDKTVREIRPFDFCGALEEISKSGYLQILTDLDIEALRSVLPKISGSLFTFLSSFGEFSIFGRQAGTRRIGLSYLTADDHSGTFQRVMGLADNSAVNLISNSSGAPLARIYLMPSMWAEGGLVFKSPSSGQTVTIGFDSRDICVTADGHRVDKSILQPLLVDEII